MGRERKWCAFRLVISGPFETIAKLRTGSTAFLDQEHVSERPSFITFRTSLGGCMQPGPIDRFISPSPWLRGQAGRGRSGDGMGGWVKREGLPIALALSSCARLGSGTGTRAGACRHYRLVQQSLQRSLDERTPRTSIHLPSYI